MSDTTATDDEQIEVEYIPDSGKCGNVGDIGGQSRGLTEQFRAETGCRRDAEYQVFEKTDPPEDATIVGVCEDHIEDAKTFLR